jgi:hypothetical protein
MTVRAALYACTTAADLGQTVHDLKLPELRRYAAVQDWEVVGEYTDAIPTGIGRRQGFERLTTGIGSGKVDVVVANALHELCWDITRMARLLLPWSTAGVRVVCLDGSLVVTSPADWVLQMRVAQVLNSWLLGRARERQRIGILRAELGAAGAPMAGRPRSVVNPLEVAAGYHLGLSQREICARIRRAGGNLSKGKVAQVLDSLRAEGQLDDSKRAAMIAERGGLPPGGRKRPPGRPLTDDEVCSGWAGGHSVAKLAAMLRAAGASCSVAILTARLRDLRAAGKLDDEAHLEALAIRQRGRRSA